MSSTQHQPLVSIVLSAYNAQNYVEEAVQSILNQTYLNIELLCFDDGSTDDTLRILKKIEDPRFKYYSDGQQKGLAARLNEGIEKAKGEFVARMDADDISLPHRLQMQVSYMLENEHVDVLGSAVESFPRIKRISQPLTHKKIAAKLLLTPAFCHPSVMFRTASLHKYNIRYPNYSCVQDYALWANLLNNEAEITFANLPDVLLRYRQHENTTTQTKKAQRFRVLQRVQAHIFQKQLEIVLSNEQQAQYSAIAMGKKPVYLGFYETLQLFIKLLFVSRHWAQCCIFAQGFLHFLKLKIKN